MRFFQKIGKFSLFGIKLTINLTIWVENSEKIGFFAKTGTNFRTLFLQISTCGYILAQLLKQLFFPHKKEVETFLKSFFCKNIHNHCRKHRKFAKFIILHNRIQISENFSLIISKTGIFSSTTAIVQQTSVNCSHTKLSK